nr:amidohydrolase family protein [Streptomyces sp. 846.5]
MEPLWLWREYIDPALRDSCLQVLRDPRDGDKLIIDGRPSSLVRRLGGVAASTDGEVVDWNSLPAGTPFVSYRDSCLRESWSGSARVEWLNRQGIDATLLFPSLGLIWPREVDPASAYAVAHHRAYNRWIADFAAAAPQRLLAVAQLALGPDTDIERELRELAAAGFAHISLPWGIGSSFGEEQHGFWASAQEHGFVVHLHKVATPHFLPTPTPSSVRSPGMGSFYNHVNEILPGQLCLAALFDARVPDLFPGLRFAFHEFNAGWVPSWLDRAQETFETLDRNGSNCLEQPPAHYLYERETFFFSIGTGESVDAMPEDLRARLLMATDYPHPGTPKNPQQEWSEILAETSPIFRTRLLGGNADHMMSLGAVSA